MSITLYLLMVLCLQELFFRTTFPIPEIDNLNRANYMPQALLYGSTEIPPNTKLTWSSYPDTVHDFIHQLNSYGFRDTEWSVAKPNDEHRVMIIGDSFAEGLMVEQHSSMPSLLSKLVADSITIMNTGILGIGMDEYLRLANDLIPIFRPDEVILVLYSNDVSGRQLEVPEHRLQPKYNSACMPRVITLFQRLMQDRPIPTKWKRPVPIIPHVPDKGNIWTENESLYRPRVSQKIADYMRAGKFNVYRTNWVLKEEMNLRQPNSVREHLSHLKELTESSGSKLTVVYVPSRHQVSTYYYQFELEMCKLECPPQLDMTTEPYQIHRAQLKVDCAALELPFIDTYNAIKEQESQGVRLYWDYDDHMRESGYEVVANTIFKNWKN